MKFDSSAESQTKSSSIGDSYIGIILGSELKEVSSILTSPAKLNRKDKGKIVYCVYWLLDIVPQHKKFECDKMNEALKFTEDLRKKQRNGETVSFVTFTSENPNSVGFAGADDTKPGYDWKKRRL